MAQKKIKQDQTDGLVQGPASATDNAVVRYDGTTGKLVQNSTEITIGDTGILRLGPAESEDPYSSARLKFSDNDGFLSDAAFTAYGNGYAGLVLTGAGGTAAAPADTGAADTVGRIDFQQRISGTYQSVASIHANQVGTMYIVPDGGLGVNAGNTVTINSPADITLTATAGVNLNGATISANSIPVVTTTGTQTLTNKTLTTPKTTRIDELDSNGLTLYAPTGDVEITVGGVLTANADPILTASNTTTVQNKRIYPRIGTTASSSTPTPAGDSSDVYTVTALAAGATFAAPSGTPTNGQKLLIRIKDNGTARTLAWNAIYRAVGVTLPTTTVISKTVYIGMVYNSTDTKWDVIAVAQEA